MSENTETPITHGNVDRGYKRCKCNRCGNIELCTPHRDFYTVGDDNGPLLCETCFWDQVRLNNT